MKRVLLRALCALLCLTAILCAVSCGDYKPVKSSKQERRAVASLQGDVTVRYELLRAFLYAFKGNADGGDDSVWSGEDADARFSGLLALAMHEISEIYATFSVCKRYGIDPYGDKVDDLVSQRVTADIDGGQVDGVQVQGYGSKKKYLQALKQMHLNDSVNRLLHRWDICSSLLYEKVVTNFNDGANAIGRDDVYDFYQSEECARITWLFLSEDVFANATQQVREEHIALVYSRLTNPDDGILDYDHIKTTIVHYGSPVLSTDQIENGFCISSYGGFGTDARKLAKLACGLGDLEISERVTTEDGVYYLIGLEKNDTYFSGHYEDLYDLCLANRLYKEIDTLATEMLENATYTDVYRSLTASSVFGAS